jgi:para-nitrobenzyl esterase
MSKIWALAATGWLLATAACAEPNVVRTQTGAVRGVEANGVLSFKGIPFASPPVGELRWRAPRPAKAWTGVRPAADFGPACIQMGMSRYASTSEDCLTLNVFRPADAKAKLPVMVWIYGGGFIQGASQRYDGSNLARRGVEVVTLNYRLGRLGFFAHPALTKAGEGADFGFLDQIAALKWVRANIARFGGDPANVTIFGESAGAISVNYLMTSPLAKGLFVKAISESGFGRTGGKTLSAAQAVGSDFAKAQGISGDGPEAAAALRALPVAALEAPVDGLTRPDSPGPIIDGVVATEPVPAAFAAGHQAKIPYLVGGNSFEVSLFPTMTAHPDAVLDKLGPSAGPAVGLWGDGDKTKAVAAMMTQAMIIEPDRFLARQQVKAGAPAYVYYFSYVPEAARAESLGAPHGAEVRYVFGLFENPTPADKAISDAMEAYWTAFAKTGAPGGAWTAAGTNGDPVMEFGADGANLRTGFKTLQLDLLARRAEANGNVLPAF